MHCTVAGVFITSTCRVVSGCHAFAFAHVTRNDYKFKHAIAHDVLLSASSSFPSALQNSPIEIQSTATNLRLRAYTSCTSGKTCKVSRFFQQKFILWKFRLKIRRKIGQFRSLYNSFQSVAKQGVYIVLCARRGAIIADNVYPWTRFVLRSDLRSLAAVCNAKNEMSLMEMIDCVSLL